MVIPPEASLAMIKDCVQAGIKKFWLQPGSESDKSIQYCKDNNLQCIYNACILLSK
jgi:predicted CoA-binding protein